MNEDIRYMKLAPCLYAVIHRTSGVHIGRVKRVGGEWRAYVDDPQKPVRVERLRDFAVAWLPRPTFRPQAAE